MQAGAGCLTTVTLSVNGEYLTGASYNPYYGPPSVRFDVAFDSTYVHFHDGSAIEIEVHAVNSLGYITDATRSAPAYNKAYVTANTYQTNSVLAAQYVEARAGEMNHSVNGTQSDVKLTILGNLATYTAYFDASDGGAGQYADCMQGSQHVSAHQLFASGDPDDVPPDEVYDIPTWVAKKTPDQPPYNFVHLYVCYCAQDSSLADSFGVSSGADRAFVGYTTLIGECQHNANWMNDLWQYLANGETIDQAKADANTHTGFPSLSDDNTNRGAIPKILGDTTMKLHGLYGVAGLQWHG